MVTVGQHHVDDNPDHGLGLSAYLPSGGDWVEAVTRDPRIEHLLQEGIEDYWIRLAPLDWLAPRVPGLAEALPPIPTSTAARRWSIPP
ncbi:hypothetical protein ETD86_50395 [Nonomuraea turkmeniaca]|uniref:Uncharacterized protein n=1 Tax=Nonomuraea turkmeniaca TaxID=103838 RepID=A0A5S4EWK6_9ACTN|nr:hypothetical protein [Nonomuraea turkmeniaca]TMR07830.1 hypothetical protein ETD86_50395 [Nonomuraea turkmeniaca]